MLNIFKFINFLVNNMVTKCLFTDCQKRASYSSNNLPPQFCKLHKSSEMKPVTYRHCEFLGCKINAIFNFKNDCGHARFCLRHKLNNMVDVKNPSCKYPGCHKQSSYGYKNNKSIFCAQHKEYNMINLRKKKCKFSGCNITAGYNFPNAKGYVYCTTHKLEGMTTKKNIQTNLVNSSNLSNQDNSSNLSNQINQDNLSNQNNQTNQNNNLQQSFGEILIINAKQYF